MRNRVEPSALLASRRSVRGALTLAHRAMPTQFEYDLGELTTYRAAPTRNAASARSTASRPRALPLPGAHGLSALAATLLLLVGGGARAEAVRPPWKQQNRTAAALWWGAFQLVPSPAMIIGNAGISGGVRWQITPFLYSFGIARDPARFFVVAPVARHTGALEFYGAPEWLCCAPDHRSSWLARAGSRVYLPVLSRGESLAVSLGGSYYYANHHHGGSAEIGAYTLGSIVGLSLTVSPWLEQRETMLTLTLRYF
jgi:hypothetical protein